MFDLDNSVLVLSRIGQEEVHDFVAELWALEAPAVAVRSTTSRVSAAPVEAPLGTLQPKVEELDQVVIFECQFKHLAEAFQHWNATIEAKAEAIREIRRVISFKLVPSTVFLR